MAENNTDQEILEKMMQIADLIEQGKESDEIQVGDINYYKDFQFKVDNLKTTGGVTIEGVTNHDIYVAKIENTAENTNTYEIYSGRTNNLIATVDEQGRLNFTPEYIENLKAMAPKIAERLKSESLTFELPKELAKEDKVLTKGEREEIARGERDISRDKQKENKDGKDEQEQEKNKDEQEEEKLDEKSPEEEQQEQIAKKKGIPSHDVLFVRTNSNLYKNYPQLRGSEPNLYFYRDKSGCVKAEYIDSNGEAKPSQYFEPSTTSLRKKSVSLGSDGNPIKEEIPYQTMRTNLKAPDNDIKENGVRVNISFDTYGYMDMRLSEQGKNGEWRDYDIEVKGRNYNSKLVNDMTSTRTGKNDPSRETEAYENVEDTGLAQDGIEYSEMYIIAHSDKVIEELIKEGYQKDEAVQIIDYVIGEEKMNFKDAKEKVNEEIGKENAEREKEEQKENEREEDDEERTQGGDAWERRYNRGKQ